MGTTAHEYPHDARVVVYQIASSDNTTGFWRTKVRVDAMVGIPRAGLNEVSILVPVSVFYSVWKDSRPQQHTSTTTTTVTTASGTSVEYHVTLHATIEYDGHALTVSRLSTTEEEPDAAPAYFPGRNPYTLSPDPLCKR